MWIGRRVGQRRERKYGDGPTAGKDRFRFHCRIVGSYWFGLKALVSSIDGNSRRIGSSRRRVST
jgi:hypothetical protein